MSEQTVTIRMCDSDGCENPAEPDYSGGQPCPVCQIDYCDIHSVSIFTGKAKLPPFCVGCLWDRIPELKEAWEAAVELKKGWAKFFSC